MNSYNNKKRRNKIILAATVTIIIFTVALYLLFPHKFDAVLRPENHFDTSQDFIKFLDVGQGDCALIYSNGYCAVVDVSTPDCAEDITENLYAYNIQKIDAVLISHLHDDHVGALPQIAKNFEIENLIMPKVLDKSIDSAKNGKATAINGGAEFYNAKQGMNFNIGEFEITLLSDFTDKSNENNRSVFVMAKIGKIKFLFTGDAEAKMEDRLLDENLNIDCDILKVSHHGSNTSSSKAFLEATTPEYAVISVGKDNMYKHPHSKTLNALKSAKADIYRTDKDGDITFYINNNNITVDDQK